MSEFFVFILFPVYIGLRSKSDAIYMINDIGAYSSHYPEWYIDTPRWIRKLFGIHKASIPRFFYYKLIFSIVLMILGPVYIIVFWIFDCNPKVEGIIILIHVCLGLIDSTASDIAYKIIQK